MWATKGRSPLYILRHRIARNRKTLFSALVGLSFTLLILWSSFQPSSSNVSLSTEEHYLAYLPHSGLSNQRIELANAILLAALLNRTLIVPPAFLGNVVGWMTKDQLLDHLGWLTTPKDFVTLCAPPTPDRLSTYVRRSKCEEYRNFGVLSWTDLHDFSPLAEHVRIRHHPIVSLTQLQQDLGIQDNETYVHIDEGLYDWRLYEDPAEADRLLKTQTNYVDSFSGRRYYKVFTLEQWQNRPEKLLQLGGIFGSTRLSVVKPEHVALRQMITETLHYRLDTALGRTVKQIVQHLGGKGTFMSVHFRTGDSPFRGRLGENLKTFLQQMAERTGATSIEPLESLNQTQQIPLTPPEDLSLTPWSTTCRNVPSDKTQSLHDLGARALIYIATDHPRPRDNDSRLLPWFQRFPCTITLNDIPSHLFDPLSDIHDLVDPTKSLKSYLIPLVDAMVAAHAREIFTTPRSTFSKYIGELNRVWVSD
ncbi:hypothetical protein EC973_002296 [Apophysomyces ossiformis]|uniref:O-fucosyltransferase family protein n=1 Tax=Apophysomyces ossiformis TaxID=679940 RepID=A0A8H7BJ88_9FUNG|nr:hypothetical protein EC973_002296 [Apophysomyces ossiformis]